MRKKSSKKANWCVVCNYDTSDISDEVLLEIWNLCRKHSKEIKAKIKQKEPKMDCPKCGCQDTEFKTGIAKTGRNIGQPWSAYDCKNPACKNEAGYPTRTFVKGQGQPKFAPRTTGVPQQAPSGIEKKLDIIISMLKTLQGDMGIEEANKELQVEANQTESPF